jgi:hypothetical protein
MDMPKPSDQHKKLNALTGTWVGSETLNPSPWGPGGTFRGRYTMHMDLDGFFMIQDYLQEQNGRTTYRGHGVFGFDTEHAEYTWYWVDSMGMPPAAASRGKWQGDTLMFEHAQGQGGTERGRYTYRFKSERALYFKIENSQDGGKSWQTFMEGNYERV